MEVLRDFAQSEPRKPPSTLAAAAFPPAAASTHRVLLSGLTSTNPLPPLTIRLLHGRLLRLDLLADLSHLLLRALSNSGLHLHALSLHSLFPDPSHLTLPFALKSASRLPNPLPFGEKLHARSLKLPSHSNPHVLISLLNLYAKCGLLDHARVVFDEMRCPDRVSWNALICAYMNAGRDKEAVATARDAFASGVRPDSCTAVKVLTACARVMDLDTGEAAWRMAKQDGIATSLVVATKALDLYIKCGEMAKAREVFDKMPKKDALAWTVMVGGYASNGRPRDALNVFFAMQTQGVRPDCFTATRLLTACARTVDLDSGEAVWRVAEREGIATNLFVATAAVNLYIKGGEMAKAREVFDKMPHKDALAWGAMVKGYASNGYSREAVELFFAMQTQGVRPDCYTVAGALSACTRLGALNLGQQVVRVVDWDEFFDNPVTGTALIDMYAKCGNTWDAWVVFRQMRERDIIVWNTMIFGLRMAGYGKAAFALVGQMKKSGMELNEMSSMSLLCSCTHNSAKATHSASANSPLYNKRPHKSLLSDSPQQCSVDMDGAGMAVAPESANTSPVPNSSGGGGGIRIENCYIFKSRLNEYAHKAGLMIPVYQTLREGPSHEPIFKSTVLINNAKYESLPGFFTRKAAEESAAEVALMEIGKSVALPTNHKGGMCKKHLEKYAREMNYAIPSYICNKQDSGVGPLICTVEIGGIQYIGATARTKKEAEIKAARTALLAIQGQSEGGANENTKYIVVPGKRQGKETEKKPTETPKPLKAKKGGFKKQRNKNKFIKKNGGAVDVEEDEARVPEETHHSDVPMESAKATQDPSIDTIILQSDEGARRVEHEPTSDTAILRSDGEGRKVEQESAIRVRRFRDRAPWRFVFEKFKILILKIQKILKNV